MVYTRGWVVELMLDLAGYVQTTDLGAGTLVEPGCGDGGFLVEVARRLLRSAQTFGRDPANLVDAVRAFDLDGRSVASARKRVTSAMTSLGVDATTSRRLAHAWIRHEDFLLADLRGIEANWVVGNPPYIRLEEVEADSYRKYRDRWSDMAGRADVYIGFFQASLSLLAEDGVLAFICADRWMHNKYGAALRRRVIEGFALDLLLELHEVDVFESRVAAYPAVTVVRRGTHSATALATAEPTFGRDAARLVTKWISMASREPAEIALVSASWLPAAFPSDKSWPSGPPERLALISDLEQRLPDLAAVGVTVGVGMATGADEVFVTRGTPNVEADRLRKAIGPADLVHGEVRWIGRSIVSPWHDGQLVDLDDFPLLRRYFTRHQITLRQRYVAKHHKDTWWRTIDRPRADEYQGAKLIVADINDRIEPVLDTEGFWPLHSAYFLQSNEWPLEALGGYLLSDVAAAFVEAYSVKMANGHFRISSQYLRKIRMPRADEVNAKDRADLTRAFRKRDRSLATSVALRMVQASRRMR